MRGRTRERILRGSGWLLLIREVDRAIDTALTVYRTVRICSGL